MYVSHVSEDGRIERVVDHLREVAEMAAEFARPFGAEKWAYLAGTAHDIGKYSAEFQNRILREGHKVDHSTAGAYELYEQAGLLPLSFVSPVTTAVCPTAARSPNSKARR